MQRSRVLLVLAVALALAHSACGNAMPEPTDTPRPTATSEPMDVFTLPGGTVTIQEVQLPERWPPNCVSNCKEALPGYQLLAVSLKAADDFEGELPEVDLRLSCRPSGDEITPALLQRVQVGSGETSQQSYEVVFTPQSSDEGFTLLWPGSDPVELGKYLEE